jgi:hypothetical protein
MLRVIPEAKDQLKEVLAWAVDNDCIDRFAGRLAYLNSFSGGSGRTMRCTIMPDFPTTDFRNFSIHMEVATGYDSSMPEGERFTWVTEFHGGLIYHHHPEQKSEQHNWGVHT